MVRRIVTDAVNITDRVMDKDATEYESDGESSEKDYQDNVEEQDEQDGELGTWIHWPDVKHPSDDDSGHFNDSD